MKVKENDDVLKMLKERYEVSRGGFFAIPGYKGNFRFSRVIGERFDGNGIPYTHDIYYSEEGLINEKKVRFLFSIQLNSKRNLWFFRDCTRTNKACKETKDYKNMESHLLAQFILWCIEDNPELLKGGAEK